MKDEKKRVKHEFQNRSCGQFCLGTRNMRIISGWWLFSPREIGEMIQFDYIIFFKWVETQPPTRNMILP